MIYTACANQLQRVFGRILKKIRLDRVRLISLGCSSTIIGLATVVVSTRFAKGKIINRCVKRYMWGLRMRELRLKSIRAAEILLKMTKEREHRNKIICKGKWEKMQLIWRKAYNCLNRAIR